jgi:YHS domain-containing protein
MQAKSTSRRIDVKTRTRDLAISLLLASGLASGLALAPAVGGAAEEKAEEKILVNRDRNGVALQGYDPVAYFTDRKPTKGDPQFKTVYRGAVYYFATREHQQLFEREPARYEPAFGGYCGYAASINRLSPISPEFWEVIDGRLVLQHNQKALDAWHQDVPGNLKKADANWPGLVERNGSSPALLVNTDRNGVAIQGHDPVAYFTEGRAVKGDPQFEAVYDGARYFFQSQQNRATFESDPARYAPAYGGYCAYAASINKVSPIDPNIFQIIDGRLMLQHTRKAYDLFNKDTAASVRKADANWPGLVARHGKREGGLTLGQRLWQLIP